MLTKVRFLLGTTAMFLTVFFALPCSSNAMAKGVWVTVFSESRPLYSTSACDDLITFCGTNKIDEIYLQVYRAGTAYYDTKEFDRAKFNDMVRAAGRDPVAYLIQSAHKKGIKVFAWVNVLSLAQNSKAEILKKYGNGVLTLDQHKRPSKRGDDESVLDKYYLRDDQLFLEPGDYRVKEFYLKVVREITAAYPGLDGMHLDYIRYPHAVPFPPDSKFIQYGLSYGYGRMNVKRYEDTTGYDPFKCYGSRDEALAWDNWKRQQVTDLLKGIRDAMKKNNPDKLLSCAVIASVERGYLAAYQDWPGWLEKGLCDYVVTMNYTEDDQLAEINLKNALANKGKGKVYNGIGVFLLKKPGAFKKQYNRMKAIGPDGMVFFSYDDLTGDAKVPAE